MGVRGSFLLVLVRMSHVIFGTKGGPDKYQAPGQHKTPLVGVLCCLCVPFDPLYGPSRPGSSCFLHSCHLSLHVVAAPASPAWSALQLGPHNLSSRPLFYSESQEQDLKSPFHWFLERQLTGHQPGAHPSLQVVVAGMGLGRGLYTWLPTW